LVLVSQLCMQIYACIHLSPSFGLPYWILQEGAIFSQKLCFFPNLIRRESIYQYLVRCEDSELACEHARTAIECFWRGKPLLRARTHWTDKICLALPKILTKFVSAKFSICQAWAHLDTAEYLLSTSVNHTEINTIALLAVRAKDYMRSHESWAHCMLR